jgi:hypothetical protein
MILTAFEIAAGIGHITTENDLGKKFFFLLQAAMHRQLLLYLLQDGCQEINT